MIQIGTGTTYTNIFQSILKYDENKLLTTPVTYIYIYIYLYIYIYIYIIYIYIYIYWFNFLIRMSRSTVSKATW